MGQFLQDRENVCFMSLFLSRALVWLNLIDLILQLILDICIFLFMKTLSFDLGKHFGVALGTLFLASLNDF